MPEATFLGREDLDVTDGDAVYHATKGVDVIVHLAAFTHVDDCEAQPELARKVNHLGTRHLAEAAMDHSIRLFYLSTDYVFDGTKETGYEESDPADPLNVYGKTKLAGEAEVARVRHHCIVRSSWIFGDGRNFIRTILGRASKRGPLRIVDDQTGRPTSATAVAAGLRALIKEGGEGIVHLAGEGDPCSWADLAEFSLRCAGSDTDVERITTETYERESRSVVAPRPRRSVLSIEKARGLGLPLLDWRAEVEREIGLMG